MILKKKYSPSPAGKHTREERRWEFSIFSPPSKALIDDQIFDDLSGLLNKEDSLNHQIEKLDKVKDKWLEDCLSKVNIFNNENLTELTRKKINDLRDKIEQENFDFKLKYELILKKINDEEALMRTGKITAVDQNYEIENQKRLTIFLKKRLTVIMNQINELKSINMDLFVDLLFDEC